MSDELRFWSKVNKDGPIPHHRQDLGKCWLWNAAKVPDGYGNFWHGDRVIRAHRFSYESVRGKIGHGLELDHLCRVRSCVNPSHLEQVTRTVNNMRSESLQAKNARKTHCIYGHSDWVRDSRGKRRCVTCTRNLSRKYYADPAKREKKLKGQRARLARLTAKEKS